MTSASISTTEIPRDAELLEQTEQSVQDNDRVLGCLPDHNIVDKPPMITWGLGVMAVSLLYQQLSYQMLIMSFMEKSVENLLIKLHCILTIGTAAPTISTYH